MSDETEKLYRVRRLAHLPMAPVQIVHTKGWIEKGRINRHEKLGVEVSPDSTQSVLLEFVVKGSAADAELLGRFFFVACG